MRFFGSSRISVAAAVFISPIAFTSPVIAQPAPVAANQTVPNGVLYAAELADKITAHASAKAIDAFRKCDLKTGNRYRLQVKDQVGKVADYQRFNDDGLYDFTVVAPKIDALAKAVRMNGQQVEREYTKALMKCLEEFGDQFDDYDHLYLVEVGFADIPKVLHFIEHGITTLPNMTPCARVGAYDRQYERLRDYIERVAARPDLAGVKFGDESVIDGFRKRFAELETPEQLRTRLGCD